MAPSIVVPPMANSWSHPGNMMRPELNPLADPHDTSPNKYADPDISYTGWWPMLVLLIRPIIHSTEPWMLSPEPKALTRAEIVDLVMCHNLETIIGKPPKSISWGQYPVALSDVVEHLDSRRPKISMGVLYTVRGLPGGRCAVGSLELKDKRKGNEVANIRAHFESGDGTDVTDEIWQNKNFMCNFPFWLDM